MNVTVDLVKSLFKSNKPNMASYLPTVRLVSSPNRRPREEGSFTSSEVDWSINYKVWTPGRCSSISISLVGQCTLVALDLQSLTTLLGTLERKLMLIGIFSTL